MNTERSTDAFRAVMTVDQLILQRMQMINDLSLKVLVILEDLEGRLEDLEGRLEDLEDRLEDAP